MNNVHILTKIKDANHISYSELADKLGVSRQYLSNIYNGKRNMTKSFEDRIKDLYPNFFNNVNNCTSIYKIPYCPEQKIPHSFDLHSRTFPSVAIDKRLFPKGVSVNEIYCRVVTISDNSLSPFYLEGDKVILDTSQTRLIDGLSYLISCNGVHYIRQIKILPDKIRCVSTNDDRDTFSMSAESIIVCGLILPKIHF